MISYYEIILKKQLTHSIKILLIIVQSLESVNVGAELCDIYGRGACFFVFVQIEVIEAFEAEQLVAERN